MSKKCTIYHNVGCGTSKKVLEWLRSHGYHVNIIEYLKSPLNLSQINEILTKGNLNIQDILRTNDKVFRELFADMTLNDSEWIRAMMTHPSIMQRPIVVLESSAYVARPFEDFVSIFSNF